VGNPKLTKKRVVLPWPRASPILVFYLDTLQITQLRGRDKRQVVKVGPNWAPLGFLLHSKKNKKAHEIVPIIVSLVS